MHAVGSPITQLRIGVIGAGVRSSIARHWHQPGGRSVVVAIADPDPANVARLKESLGADLYTAPDARLLYDRPDIDAVAVLSPDDCHEEQVVAALQAGKHVFCEKPMAITIEGCDRMLDAQRRSGRKLMVGFNMRYMPMFRTMKEILDSGAIGEIKAVWVRHFVGHGGNFYFHDWHGRRRNGTSLLLQKASHDIDMIHWLSGRYTRRVTALGGLDYFGGDKPNDLHCRTCPDREVCVERQPDGNQRDLCAYRSEIDVEDNNMVLMELEGGIKAAYLQCHFTPDYHRNYVFIGTEGRMENSEPDNKVWVKTRRSNSYRELADRTYEVKPLTGTHGGADPIICADFVDMVLDGKEPIASAIAGRMSVAAGCRATDSLRQGGTPFEVPPYQP